MQEADFTNKTVIVADDDPDARAIISAALGMHGFVVVEAVDGEIALNLCRAKMPDMLILDWMMPNLSGVDACAAIRTLPEGQSVPIIMITARDRVEDKVSALDIGADDYMTKPFQYQELMARIRALFRVRELNLELAQVNKELAAAQGKVVEQQRQLAVTQLAGSAAHQLGQPLAAITLNCFLLETLGKGSAEFSQALVSVKADVKRMAKLIELLKESKATQQQGYHGHESILALPDE